MVLEIWPIILYNILQASLKYLLRPFHMERAGPGRAELGRELVLTWWDQSCAHAQITPQVCRKCCNQVRKAAEL